MRDNDQDEVPRRKGEHVSYEGGAEVDAPVDPKDLPAKRSDRAPPHEAGAEDKGQGEVERQAPPRGHTPAANEALDEDDV